MGMCLALKKVDTKVNKMEKQSKTKTRKARRWIPQDIKMEIVRDFHFEGLKQALIAERHGISQQTVSRILCNFAAENNTWEKIAVDMHYSIQHIYRMHDTALAAVEEILPHSVT